ncbi:uncharacterized protein LOC114338869 isoform X1 [Diabrotica virgifera virgifera]|uniref:Uncharacterized protein LOC114337394 isoform X1 n=2 Tax=Diabrotica virgifera virgifera TaxID=50390 RepID=A0A6P7G3U8_DIAVI|nr:uncharacterized protein LOC114338869 isoform X1 [Diabrotica virgifera virgifera]
MEVNGSFSLLCLWFSFIGLVSATLEINSIDTNSIIRKTRQSSLKCTLPPQIENGKWLITEADVQPGDQIEVNTIVRLECNEGYQLYPYNTLMACDSNWDEEDFPVCRKKCPSFYSTATTKLICKDKDENTITCDKATDGTYLTYSCVAFYEVPPGGKNVLYCNDGIWDFPKPLCKPICGKKVTTDTTELTWGGTDVKGYEYPWVIAMFKKLAGKYENVCGGTLVSRRVVVTAAHCVTDNYGNALGRENFQVAAGKLYNAFGDPRDKHAQYRKISQVVVHPGYRGVSQRYVADLALLITQELFKLEPVIMPACFDNVNTIYLKNYQVGEVAGWGLTEEEKPSERLRVIKIPYKEGATCSRELPESWEEQYNFLDKICAGRVDQQIAVCQGDSGSGLVFKNREDSRYYIQGLVSIAPNLYTSKCNYQTNALYTSVAFYYTWINKEMTINYLEDCLLPPHPRNGKWSVGGGEKKPGDIVLSNTILTFSCNRGYILSSISPHYDCANSYNPPTCLILCPKMSLPSGSQIICKNAKNQHIQCEDVADGGSVTFTCPNGFVSDRGTPTSTKYCRNGAFSNTAPSCILKALYKPTPEKHKKPSSSGSTEPYSLIPSKPITRPTKPSVSITVPEQGVEIGTDGLKVICTYASWMAYQEVYPENFESRLCTHLVYQFIGLRENGELRIGDEWLDLYFQEQGLYRMTTDLKQRNKDLKVLLSVGGSGATNETLFRDLSKDDDKIKAFLSSAAKIMETYNFDGLDIFWFSPAKDDKANFIHLLETIKRDFEKNGWILSITVHPVIEQHGYDAKEISRIVDWVTIKTYDFYGSWSLYTGNHNALYPSSKENGWEKQRYNLDAVAKTWLKAGLYKNKLVLGVAFSGVGFSLKDKSETGVHAPINKAPSFGEIRYYTICTKHADFTKVWDNETKTPYSYNDTFWIGFNDPQAVRLKGEYVKNEQLAGLNVFSIDGDDNKGVCGEKYVLLKNLNTGMGHSLTWLKDN